MSKDSITPQHRIYIDDWLIEPKDLTAMGRAELIHLISELQRTLRDVKYQQENK